MQYDHPDDHPDDEDTGFDTGFDTGDGTADTDRTVHCPHCGEENVIAVDPGSGTSQRYVEDCQVCCRPWSVFVTFDEAGRASVDVEQLDA